MKFFGNIDLLKSGQLKNVLLQSTDNANQDNDFTEESQIGYNAEEQAVIYHDGTAVRFLATKKYVDALVGGNQLIPSPFDATSETTFPSEEKRYVVTHAGVIDGITLEPNDILIPSTEVPTGSASDWIVIQGNLDKADLSEIVNGVDNIKYVTPAGLKHFKENALGSVAGKGIAWDEDNKTFFIDLTSESGLTLDIEDKLQVLLQENGFLERSSTGIYVKVGSLNNPYEDELATAEDIKEYVDEKTVKFYHEQGVSTSEGQWKTITHNLDVNSFSDRTVADIWVSATISYQENGQTFFENVMIDWRASDDGNTIQVLTQSDQTFDLKVMVV